MYLYLYHLSDLNLFLVLSIGFIAFSLIAVIFIRRFIPMDMLYADNTVVGYVSSLIGIIYGVLVGLMALYLINNLNATSDAVLREANATSNLYRESKWFAEPTRGVIKVQIKKYLNEVINVEWPLMQAGNDVTVDGDDMINDLSQLIGKYPVKTEKDALMQRDFMEEIKSLYNAQQQRIDISKNELNKETWMVIVIGTVLTMAVIYLFGMNYYLHLVVVSAVSLMAASLIFLLISLDRPFQGEFGVQPEALKSVLMYIEKD